MGLDADGTGCRGAGGADRRLDRGAAAGGALDARGADDVAGFIAGFAGDDRYIVDYLVEEVLQRQPEHVRSFLLQTSILDRLTGPLCDAVTGQDGGKAMLEALDRANLFLVPLDDRRRWYRYHHLFADVLRARLLRRAARIECPSCTGGRATGTSRTANRSEAIRHALAGGGLRASRGPDRAGGAGAAAGSRRRRRLLRWLGALPDELVGRRPVLSVALRRGR